MEDLLAAPEIARWVIKQKGVGIGWTSVQGSIMNIVRERIIKWVAGVWQMELTATGSISEATKPEKINQTTFSRAVPLIVTVAIRKLWQTAIDQQNIGLLKKAIGEKLTPNINELVGLWYYAEGRGKTVSLAWLSESNELLKLIKKDNNWLRGVSQYNVENVHEYSLANFKLLDSLGIDLEAVYPNGMPWIQRIHKLIGKKTLTWMVKNRPALLSLTDASGKTLVDKLDPSQKAVVEKEMLKKYLINKQHPRRNQIQAKRI